MDGGRVSARGYEYQYLRTLEALLACVDNYDIHACRVEGPPGAASLGNPDSVDFDLVDHHGNVALAAQVKSAGIGIKFNAPDAFAILLKLISSGPADRYELIVSAEPDANCRHLADLLDRRDLTSEAKIELIAETLSRSRNSTAKLAQLSQEMIARLGNSRIKFDRRTKDELCRLLRDDLRSRRGAQYPRLGERSAGLVVGYLVAEILKRAVEEENAYWELSDFRRQIMVTDEDLTRALGYQEWGAVYGPVAPVPVVQRTALLRTIETRLFTATDKASMQSCVLAGLSGIGKSSLASSYIAECANRYEFVFWVDATSEDSLTRSFLRIRSSLSTAGREMGSDDSTPSLREHVHDLLRQIPGPWLLVFDDATPSHIREWLPPTGNGHLLLTSIDSVGWSKSHKIIPIEAMARTEAVHLASIRLFERMEPDDTFSSAIQTLVEELECWPLAIELACGYISSCGISVDQISEYLALIKSRALDDSVSIPQGYPRTLVAAVRMGLHRIQNMLQHDPYLQQYAAQMLLTACYFAPNQIPLHLLASASFIDPEHETNGGVGILVVDETQIPIREVVRALAQVSFVRYSAPLSTAALDGLSGATTTLSTNAVLQEVVRSFQGASPSVADFISRTSHHVERWLTFAMETGNSDLAWEIATHATAVCEHAIREEVRNDETTYLIGNLGAFHYAGGDCIRARELLELEISWLEGIEEPDDHLVAQARIVLVEILGSGGPDVITDIERHLEQVLTYVASLAFSNSSKSAFLATRVHILLEQLMRGFRDSKRLRTLHSAFGAVIESLPSTPASRVLTQMAEVGRKISLGEGEQAELLARELLAQGCPALIQEIELRRLIIECIAQRWDWTKALAELRELIPRIRPPRTLFRQSLDNLTHNVGLAAATAWLIGDNEAAGDVLVELLEVVDIAELMRTATAEYRIRFALLEAVACSRTMDAESFSAAVAKINLTSIGETAADRVWLSLLNGIRSKLTWDVMRRETETQREVGFLERPTFKVDTAAAELKDHIIDRKRLPEFFLNTEVAARYLVTSDPEFSLTSLTRAASGIDRLDHDTPASISPVVIMEPRYFLGSTRPEDGGSSEMQIDGICMAGFLRIRPDIPFIRPAYGWSLVRNEDGIALYDGGVGLWAQAEHMPPSRWLKLARRRGRVLVFYGFGFDLWIEDQPDWTPELFTRNFIDSAQKGWLAAAFVDWVEPPVPPGSVLAMREQPQTKRKDKKGRRRR